MAAADVPQSIKFWPGKGNTELANIGYDMNQNLAPFFDYDLDGVYNPLKGDFPIIKDCSEAFAD